MVVPAAVPLADRLRVHNAAEIHLARPRYSPRMDPTGVDPVNSSTSRSFPDPPDAGAHRRFLSARESSFLFKVVAHVA